MRRFTVSVVALVSMLALGSAAFAGRPEVFKVSLDDPAVEAEEAAFVSGVCGFPVTVDAAGKIVVHVFSGGRNVEIANFNIHATYTNPSNGKSYRLLDAGPDRFFVRDGRTFVAISGRSLTGSGVIGMRLQSRCGAKRALY